MAESVIELVLNELSRVVREEIDLQRGIKQEIEKLREELKIMKAFLSCTDAQKEKDPMLESWVEQVRDVAFEIEDVVDHYLLRVAYGQGDGDDAHNTCLGRICSIFRKLKGKHQIGSELRSITDKVKEIAEGPKRYGYELSRNLYEQGSSSSTGRGSLEIEQFRRSNATLVEESQLVGINETKQKLVDLLNDGDTHLKVLAIVGMGGLGKTALARQIYREMSNFQRRAFVMVSQTFNEEDFVKDMMQQLFPMAMLEMQHLPIHRLKEGIRERLKDESFLIVVDDVWKIKHWDQIKVLFPRNKHGSRVVVTTRMARVAKHSSSEYNGKVHQLQPLSDDASWELFCKHTFPTTQTCPSNLVAMCEDIVFNKCMGVPIAILAISGLLRNKDERDAEAWINKVRHSLEIELEENEELEMTKKILSLSIDDLPYHLKPCYMYLGIFPEDYEIEWKRVIRLWISESFVAKRGGRTVEEDADSYLWELVNRNLIQTTLVENGGTRRPKAFRIHDFLRDIVLSKSKQERFVEVISKKEVMDIRARRLSFHDGHDALKRLSQLLPIRSLLMFFLDEGEGEEGEDEDEGEGDEGEDEDEDEGDAGEDEDEDEGEGEDGPSKLPNDAFKFRLLGVLDLERAPLDSFPEEICTLLLLRYLSLRKTKISNVPKSIGNLARLETLDLKYTFIAELPDQISMLQKLRHLLICRWHMSNFGEARKSVDKYKFLNHQPMRITHGSCGVKVTTNIGGLVWLQELRFIEVQENGEWIKALGNLSELKKLGLVGLKEEHWREVCRCISKLRNLRSLMLQTNEWFKLEYLRSPPPALERLQLNGHMKELPSWMSASALKNLQVLRLYNTRLEKDPGATLGSFPNLVGLFLYKAFKDGVKMRVLLPGSFPSLRKLKGMTDHSTLLYTSHVSLDWKRLTSDVDDMGMEGAAIGLDILIPLT